MPDFLVTSRRLPRNICYGEVTGKLVPVEFELLSVAVCVPMYRRWSWWWKSVHHLLKEATSQRPASFSECLNVSLQDFCLKVRRPTHLLHFCFIMLIKLDSLHWHSVDQYPSARRCILGVFSVFWVVIPMIPSAKYGGNLMKEFWGRG